MLSASPSETLSCSPPSDPQSYTDGNWYKDKNSSWHSPDGFLYRNMWADSTIADPQPQLGWMETNVWRRPPRQPTIPHHYAMGEETLHNFKPSLELVDTSSPVRSPSSPAAPTTLSWSEDPRETLLPTLLTSLLLLLHQMKISRPKLITQL